MTAADDAIRASDAERDAVVEILRQHAADGRLSMAEFEERVAEALAARTRGDLGPVLRELPPLPRAGAAEERPRDRRRRPRAGRALVRPALVALAAVAVVALVLQGAWWAIFPFFWIVGGASAGGCGTRRSRAHGACSSAGRHHMSHRGHRADHRRPGAAAGWDDRETVRV